jgi:hypothetical protein
MTHESAKCAGRMLITDIGPDDSMPLLRCQSKRKHRGSLLFRTSIIIPTSLSNLVRFYLVPEPLLSNMELLIFP